MAANNELDLQGTETERDDGGVLLPEDSKRGFDLEDVRGQRADMAAVIAKPSEKARIIDRLRLVDQYGNYLDTLDRSGFLRDVSGSVEVCNEPPSFDAVIKSLMTRELKISTEFQQPKLIIRPEINMRAKIQAIDANLPDNGRTMPGSEAVTQVNESFSDIDAGSQMVTGWRSFIVDGAREMEPYEGDPINRTLKDRIGWGKAGLRLGENFIDPDTYLMLVMEAIKNGEPIDQSTYTIFPGYDPAMAPELVVPRVFLAKWSEYYKRLILSWDAPMHIDPRARTRRCVGGSLIK